MRDWHINAFGDIEAGQDAADIELPEAEYRLYRFLTELEDLISTTPNDAALLRKVAPMVRRLLTSSYWLQGSASAPNPKTGWSVDMLYDEPEFPLTVQMVSWKPGMTSSIHNHAAWGLVAFVDGSEKNTIWQETSAGTLEKITEKIFSAGDIVTFEPETIHHIEALGEDPVISFNLYGKTDYKKRYKFDLETNTKKLF